MDLQNPEKKRFLKIGRYLRPSSLQNLTAPLDSVTSAQKIQQKFNL